MVIYYILIIQTTLNHPTRRLYLSDRVGEGLKPTVLTSCIRTLKSIEKSIHPAAMAVIPDCGKFGVQGESLIVKAKRS